MWRVLAQSDDTTPQAFRSFKSLEADAISSSPQLPSSTSSTASTTGAGASVIAEDGSRIREKEAEGWQEEPPSQQG